MTYAKIENALRNDKELLELFLDLTQNDKIVKLDNLIVLSGISLSAMESFSISAKDYTRIMSLLSLLCTSMLTTNKFMPPHSGTRLNNTQEMQYLVKRARIYKSQPEKQKQSPMPSEQI